MPHHIQNITGPAGSGRGRNTFGAKLACYAFVSSVLLSATAAHAAQSDAQKIKDLEAQISRLQAQKTKLLKETGIAAPTMSAADTYAHALPAYKAAKAHYDWSGLYGGVSAGYNWSKTTTDYSYSERDYTFVPANFPEVVCIDDPSDPSVCAGSGGGGGGGSNNWGEITTGYEIFNPEHYFGSVTENDSGFAGGLHLGYNWQPARNFVFGIEGDITWLNRKSTASASNEIIGEAFWNCTGCTPADGNIADTYDWGSIGSGYNRASTTVTQDWLGTVRARAGAVITDRLMVFGTGGLAFADVKVAASNTRSYTLTPEDTVANDDSALFGTTTQTWSNTTSQNRYGYAIGGGAEYAVTDNWLIRAEYLYYNLGTVRQNLQESATESEAVTNYGGFLLHDDENISTSTKIDGQIVRGALIYRF